MACNCGKSKRSVRNTRNAPRRSQIGGVSSSPARSSNNVSRARNMRNPVLNSSNPNVLSGDKKRIAKIRREAIRKALNR